MSDNGPLWVLFLFWVVAWGDTGALYAGTYLGRHKLCPAVSPKKTIEGAVGGLLANLLFGWIFKLLFFSSMGALTCTIFALTVGGVGQIGDLFESVFKRASAIKDSSNLIPGHGGFLDRLDAILFAAPIGFFLKEYLLP
jgi:phosphatidate cytidylyltransferase